MVAPIQYAFSVSCKEPLPKHPRKESSPFEPLFNTILQNLADGLNCSTIKDNLSCNQDLLCLFIYHSIHCLRLDLDVFCKNDFVSLKNKTILTLISQELYEISLKNSSTMQTLEQIEKDLPQIQHLNVGQSIELLRGKAAVFFSKCGKKHPVASLSESTVRSQLTELSSLIGSANKILSLRKYLDPENNNRLYDLATILEKKLLITSYSTFTKRISPLSKDIQALYPLILNIQAAQRELTVRAVLFSKITETRQAPLLLAYSEPLYSAAAHFFWSICSFSTKSEHKNPKFTLFLKQHKIDPSIFTTSTNLTTVNKIWDSLNFLNDIDFDNWIQRMLASYPQILLDETVQNLERLSKEIEETKSSSLEESIKQDLILSAKTEMEMLSRTLFETSLPKNPNMNDLKDYLGT